MSIIDRIETMATRDTAEKEARDAERVDQAIHALQTGNLKAAESILLSVIENTPLSYSNSSEDEDGSLSIKFWDQQDFIHYVTWQQQHGVERSIQWIGNAYPRAHYYMGFLCVKTRQNERAIKYLEQGHQLEPTNPLFLFEKAQALIGSGDKKAALSLYESVTEIGPYVSARDLAVALRG